MLMCCAVFFGYFGYRIRAILALVPESPQFPKLRTVRTLNLSTFGCALCFTLRLVLSTYALFACSLSARI